MNNHAANVRRRRAYVSTDDTYIADCFFNSFSNAATSAPFLAPIQAPRIARTNGYGDH